MGINNKAIFADSLGYKILRLKEVDSTNSYILSKYNTFATKQVVIAENQTKAKGRKGRSWQGGKSQGLALSILLKEGRINRDFATLPLVTGLAVKKTLSSYLLNENMATEIDKEGIKLKWVNDIVYSGKKIGGILCESRIFLDSTIYAVGIGINLNETREFFLKNKIPNAISMKNITNSNYDILEVSKKLLVNFDVYYNILKTKGFLGLMDEYNESCANINKEVKANVGGKELVGTALGVDNTGNLILKTKEGQVSVNSSEATIRGTNGYY